MRKTSIVYKFTGLMFLVILVTVSVLIAMANWQMTSQFRSYMGHTSMHLPQEQFLSSMHDSLIWVGFVILLAGLAASYLLARRVTDPLRKLSAAAEQIGAGKYNTAIEEQGNDEVEQLAGSLRAMAEALQTNQRLRERLFADIAHELRTPLAVIQGNLEGMLEDVVPADKEQLASLLEETVHLKRLISDLRDLSLAEAKQLKIDLVPADINQLIERVVVLLKPMAEEKAIQIRFDDGQIPEVSIDSGRITQVVYNLLVNAIHYTPEQGKVVVSTGIEKLDGQDWMVTKVEDNGPGIPAADVPYIFDHFYRVDPSRDRRSGGSGIGLAIVKQLVEIHGGKVKVQSMPGVGSVFYFYLPLDT